MSTTTATTTKTSRVISLGTFDWADEVIDAVECGELQVVPSEQWESFDLRDVLIYSKEMQNELTSTLPSAYSVQFIDGRLKVLDTSLEPIPMLEEAESVKEALQKLHTSNILEPKPLRVSRKNSALDLKSENRSHSSNIPTDANEVADISNPFQDWEDDIELDDVIFFGEYDRGGEGTKAEINGDAVMEVSVVRNSYNPYNPYENQKHPFHHVLTGFPTPPRAPRGSVPEVANYPLWNYYNTFETTNPNLTPLTPFDEWADLIKMDIIPTDRRMTTTELEVMTDPRIGKYMCVPSPLRRCWTAL